jgi:cobalt/nickel transport protein
MTNPPRHRWRFWIGFAAATLVIAGVLSYFASSSPDGLDSATLQGCDVVHTGGGDQLTGRCIAQHATDHAMSTTPLAGYTLFGDGALGGLAGVIGVVVTLTFAGGAFWLIARSRRTKPPAGS